MWLSSHFNLVSSIMYSEKIAHQQVIKIQSIPWGLSWFVHNMYTSPLTDDQEISIDFANAGS